MFLKVDLAPGLLAGLEQEALRTVPHEACALLLGQRKDNLLSVETTVMSKNVTESDPKRTFEIDPSVYIHLQKAARAGGAQVVGVWHSHPGGRAEPSATDKARSVEGGWLWLITSVQGGTTESAAYVADAHEPQIMLPVSLALQS